MLRPGRDKPNPYFSYKVREESGAAERLFRDGARAFQVTRIKVNCCRHQRFVQARRVNAQTFFVEPKRRNL
jgi:hypothetical protein